MFSSTLTVSLLLFTCSQCATRTNPRKDGASDMFQVFIGAEHHVVQGRISADSVAGSLVPSNRIKEGDYDANSSWHLRVEIRDSLYKREELLEQTPIVNNSNSSNSFFQYPVVTFENQTLPDGMEFVVTDNHAFRVDENRYIVVDDLSSLHGDTRVHFTVILRDDLAKVPVVSNRLIFVVEFVYTAKHSEPLRILFPALLIFIIVAISLLIPFTVRAKRRHKAGKPVCGCGSAAADDICESEIKNFDGKARLSIMLGQWPNRERRMTIQTGHLDPDLDIITKLHSNSLSLSHPEPRGSGYVIRDSGGHGVRGSVASVQSEDSYIYPANFNAMLRPGQKPGLGGDGGEEAKEGGNDVNESKGTRLEGAEKDRHEKN